MQKEKILITGGAGYIGSVLTSLLLENNYQVTVLDNLLYKQISLLHFCGHKDFKFVKNDVTNFEFVKNLLPEFDIIIPLAAIVGAPACNMNPSYAKKVNFDAIDNIIKNVTPNQKILFPNTNSGYGIGQKNKLCCENSPLNPLTLYGKLKVEAEKLILSAKKGISFRLATVFGVSPRMRLDLLVNDFTFRAIHDKFLVLFEQHFKRNYIHVKDVSNAFLFGIKNYETMKGQAFNVGLSSANLSKRQLAEKIQFHLKDLYVHSSDIGKDPDKRDYIVSNEKLENLGWKPKYSLDDGIKEIIAAYPFLKQSSFKNV